MKKAKGGALQLCCCNAVFRRGPVNYELAKRSYVKCGSSLPLRSRSERKSYDISFRIAADLRAQLEKGRWLHLC
jgi:hypothetical protein